MKRKTLLLMMILALFSSGAWAQTPEIYTSYTWINGTTDNGHSRNLVDNDKNSKWCHLQQSTYAASQVSIIFQSNDLITPVGYVLTTGDDAYSWPGRNPKTWTIEASNDQNNWDLLDSKTDYTGLPTTNKTDAEFTFTNTTAYRYFKFTVSNVMATYSEDDGWWVVQLNEFQFKVVPNSSGGSSSYCTPTLTSATTTYYISNFTTTGGSTNINNSTSGAGHLYSDFYNTHSLTAAAGSTINFTITIAGGSGSTHGSAIWVDWNNDGDFSDDGERVHQTSNYTSSPHSGSFTVPANATAGDHRMRIVTDYYDKSPSNPCSADTGEFEDYKLTVSYNPYITLAPTSATVLTGFTQTLTANYGNVSGTPIITYTTSDANVATVSGNGTTATVTGVASGTATITASMTVSGTTYSATSEITVENPSYCTPNPSSRDGKGITSLTFGTGDYVVNNSNSNGLPANSPYYGDYTSMVGSIEAGDTGTVTITYSTGSSTVYSYGTLIWVDWNKNYEFEDSEIVYTGTSAQVSGGTPQVLNATFTVPATQAADDYRMRIAGADSYFDSYIGGNASANHSPCFSSTYAVCHDYTLRVIPTSTEPSITLAPETATLRLGSTLALTATVRNVSDPNITYTSSDNSIATVSGSGTTATVRSVAEGTVTITASMSVGGETYTARSTIVVQDMPLRVGDGTNATYLTWEEFAAGPANGTTYSGQTVYLEKDITTNVKVSGNNWTSGNAFRGTFDGQGYTITLDMNSTETQASLFNYTFGATIKNLKVDGTITSTGSRAAGFVGLAQSGITFENCISDVTITSTSVQNGGFVGDVVNGATFKGCAFTGKLLGETSHDNGGFVGHYHYDSYTRTYTNCVFAPSEVTMGTSGSYTFCRLPNTTDDWRTTITNCYYTESFGTEQGKQAYTITGGTGITVELNGLTDTYTYSVSSIAGYGSSNKGMRYNGTILAGNGDNVSLNLNGSDEYQADHGTLTQSGNNWSLAMEAYDTKISAIACATPTAFTYTALGSTYVTLTWTAGDQEDEWEVKYWANGDTEPADGQASSYSETTCTITGLTLGVAYHAKVRAVCDAQNNEYSDWVQCDFTTSSKTFTNNSSFGDHNWSDPSNWNPIGVPTTDDDVTIAANVTIGNGVLAQAHNITNNNATITIADGGQLWHNNTGVNLTIERAIAAYHQSNAQTNLGYKIISFPVSNLKPNSQYITGLLTTDHYDFYTFDYTNQGEDDRYLEWMHVSNGDLLDPNMGYLYASQEGTTIRVTGEVAPSSEDNTTYELTLDPDGGEEPFFGWQLVGNPFVCNAYLTAENDNLNFYEIKDYNDYAEFYPISSAVEIPPMGGVMVWLHDDDNLVYSRTAPNSKGPGILNMDVNKASMRGTTMLDRARVRFGEGRNLKKLQLNPRHTKLYIPEDGNDFYLLQTPYYAFDAKSTDYASRFTLVFATGSSTGSDNFAFFNNGVWIINNPSTGSGAEATLQVVDMLGRILSSETISGSCSKAINVAPGVYMLRLVNGNVVKVQKIVVR